LQGPEPTHALLQASAAAANLTLTLNKIASPRRARS
jgi:hypothetical protein